MFIIAFPRELIDSFFIIVIFLRSLATNEMFPSSNAMRESISAEY